MQFGTFQPVDRLHSDHGDRLPWDYTGAAADSATKFLRLREALVPYTYTLAQQANATGVPIVRPLYLELPGSNAAAYTNPGEYLYGDNLLVAPITTPNDANGNGSATVWVPPGSWTDYFTGTTYTGPTTVTITAPLSRMPVLVSGGGIVPTRTDYVDYGTQRSLTQVTVNVAAGADGDFALYQDAGDGVGYRSGQSTSTPLSWRDGVSHADRSGRRPARTRVRRPAARTHCACRTASRRPRCSVDGVQVPETAWAYNGDRRIVTVTTGDAAGTGSAHTISLSGSATANPATGEVIGPANLCLDVRGGIAAEGQPLQLYTLQPHGRPASAGTK